ncbi:MAG: fluoride efflux transporter FluC [Leucobacter sp.]
MLLSSGLFSPVDIVAVAIAGGVGAVCRYGLDEAVQRGKPGGPLGILLVNLLASLAIGLLVGLGLAGAAATGHGTVLLGTVLAGGLLGGFSTFSTVAVDTARLISTKRWAWTALNTVGMLVLCALACLAGHEWGLFLYFSDR